MVSDRSLDNRLLASRVRACSQNNLVWAGIVPDHGEALWLVSHSDLSRGPLGQAGHDA